MRLLYLYGFVTSVNAINDVSGLLSFECTDALWFNDAIDRRMNVNYNFERIRAVLAQRDYRTAWESGVAVRNFLRHAYQEYTALVLDPDLPPPLSTYEVLLAPDDGRIQGDGNIGVGLWYGLELRVSGVAGPEIGTLVRADPVTGRMGNAEPHSLVRLRHLAARPDPAPPADDVYRFEAMFRSQPILQALHFARGE